jgi:PAS domain S-box-containing protein
VSIAERLYRLGATLTGERDLERIVQVITDEATAVSGARFGAFFYNVVDEHGKSYMLYTLSGVPREAFARFPMPRNTPVFGPTFHGEGVVRSDDITQDPRYGQMEPHRGMPKGHLPVRSYLAVPVISRDETVLGGLFFGHPEVGRFTEEHEQLVVGLASWAAVAMDNARLFEEASAELEKRRQSEARLQVAVDAGRMGTWEWRIGEGRVIWSETLERIHGLEPGTFGGDFAAYQRDIHPEDRERVLGTIGGSSRGDHEHHLEYRIVRPDGEVRWLEARGRLLRNARGEPERMLGVCMDVTEKKRDADALRFLVQAGAVLASSLDYEATLRSLAELAVPALGDWCAVDVLEDSGRIRRLAVAHLDPRKIQLARELEERYPSDPNATRGLRWVLRTGRVDYMEDVPDELLAGTARDEAHLEVLRAIGIRSYVCVPLIARDRVLGALTFVASESGRRYGPSDVSVAEDLARNAASAIDNARLHRQTVDARIELEARAQALREAQEELEVMNEELRNSNDALIARGDERDHALAEAEEANRAKAEFLAGMSHELRTPLNAIAGYAQLLLMELRGPLTPEQRADLERIQRSQGRLLALVNDVLNFAKLEAGRVSFDVQTLPANALFEDLESAMRPQMTAKSLSYECRLGDPSVSVRADRERAQQVILNLLSNAIKFTSPSGNITMDWTATDGVVDVRVADTGCGIPADKLEAIFDPFVQLDPGMRGASEGVGLGLAISRDIARNMGGDVLVESAPGVGSTFTLRLARA